MCKLYTCIVCCIPSLHIEKVGGDIISSPPILNLTDPHKSSFQSIVLDDPSFPDLILNSLKLNHKEVTRYTIKAITNIVLKFEWMRERFRTTQFVGRMFETVAFVSLPLSDSDTHFHLTRFITCMLFPSGYTEETPCFEQYPPIRASVLEPAKEYITFIFRNSDRLILSEANQKVFDAGVYITHHHIKNMDLRLDELDADIVSAFVNWEMRTMVAMEEDSIFCDVFESMFRRICEWKRDKPERLKRREVVLREEGWDDTFELRVVGIERNTNQKLKTLSKQFRVKQSFNVDSL
ncbi:hypothetical protein BLNAU_11383 [Blattamonas nauphoetae]|uniref:Uncharacterized protein n=1 Tax=Blattamonas nauphoetae TaxID=2049346 RepID=A0ABQ9XMP6_9EUKA|nr:hypothetical protein BLNAU_11383 [Blattamonas nauphoetae]